MVQSLIKVLCTHTHAHTHSEINSQTFTVRAQKLELEMNGRIISSSGSVWYCTQTKSESSKSTSNLEHNLFRFMALIFSQL